MKKSISLLFTLMLALVLSACGDANDNNKKDNAGDNKTEITIGTEGTYAPFTFHDEKTNELTGFDVDIATEVFTRAGYEPKFIESKWDGLIAGLDAKRYQVVANQVGITDERLEKYDFSDPYIVSKAVVIVKDDNTTITNLDDLKGKKVASSATSNYRSIAEEHGAKITMVDGFSQAVDLVTSGRVDATLNDNLSFLDLKKQRPELKIKTSYTEDDASKSALLFPKGNEDLIEKANKALAEMKEDGTYLQISEKWFGADVSK